MIKYTVNYVGAPYGDNEQGEVLSSHKTIEAAEKAKTKLHRNPKYYGRNTRINQVAPTPKPIRKERMRRDGRA